MMVVKFQNSVLYFSARRFGTGQGPDARVEMVMGWAWPLRGLGLWAGMVPGNGVGRGGGRRESGCGLCMGDPH